MCSQAYPSLKTVSIGAGAIGTYIGGSLALHGNQVVFIEQPDVAEELRRHGLLLKLDDGEHQIPHPQVSSNLKKTLQDQEFDVAIFALKAFDTFSAVKSLLPYREQLPPILCLQNGVENEAILAEFLGEDRVIAGTLTSAVGRRGVGDIILERKRGIGVAAGHPLSNQLVEILNVAGLNAHLYPSATNMKWSKLLTNLLANATSAILDMSPAEIFSDPDLCHLEINQLREVIRVMAAQGIDTIDLPGTPVKALAFAVRWLPIAWTRPILIKAVGSGRGGKMPSFHVDLRSGRGQTEVDYLNGAVVRFGDRLDIPIPVNRLLNETLLDLTSGRLPIDAFDHHPERLLERFAPMLNR